MTGKNRLIELYRFFMAISIVVFHALSSWKIITNLRLGVEFFFILSGFLLMDHCERKPDESLFQLMKGKIAHLYPYLLVIYCVTTVTVARLEGEDPWVMGYQYLHQLLFLSDILNGKTVWMQGAGQMWFITSQLWATLLLAWLIKNRRKTYESILGFLIMTVGYAAVIRCSGNLTTNVYWKIGEEKIFVPLTLFRAMAGMACGTLVYQVFRKMKDYAYTTFAEKGGTLVSAAAFLLGMILSCFLKKSRINAFGWRSMIVVLLYAAAIAFAFVFSGKFPGNEHLQKACELGGTWSLLIYLSHRLPVYVLEQLQMPYGKKYWVVLFASTAVLSLLLEGCVRLLRILWRKAACWLRKKCIVPDA